MILNERQLAILDYLERFPGCTTPAIAQGLDLTTSATRGTLEALYRHNLVGRQAPFVAEGRTDDWKARKISWRWYSARVIA